MWALTFFRFAKKTASLQTPFFLTKNFSPKKFAPESLV